MEPVSGSLFREAQTKQESCASQFLTHPHLQVILEVPSQLQQLLLKPFYLLIPAAHLLLQPLQLLLQITEEYLCTRQTKVN